MCVTGKHTEGPYLAKQETSMKASNTMLGRVPAKLNTRVINIRSMLDLLSAEAIVKPPMRSIIVGENMIEKTYLCRKSFLLVGQRV